VLAARKMPFVTVSTNSASSLPARLLTSLMPSTFILCLCLDLCATLRLLGSALAGEHGCFGCGRVWEGSVLMVCWFWLLGTGDLLSTFFSTNGQRSSLSWMLLEPDLQSYSIIFTSFAQVSGFDALSKLLVHWPIPWK